MTHPYNYSVSHIDEFYPNSEVFCAGGMKTQSNLMFGVWLQGHCKAGSKALSIICL